MIVVLNGVLGSRRGGENKSRGLEVVVTWLGLRHGSPDGADGYAEDLSAFGLTLAPEQCFQAGEGLCVESWRSSALPAPGPKRGLGVYLGPGKSPHTAISATIIGCSAMRRSLEIMSLIFRGSAPPCTTLQECHKPASMLAMI